MNPEQYKTWILTADTNKCRIYETKKKNQQFILIKELLHSVGRSQDKERVSAKSAAYKTKAAFQEIELQISDPKEIETDRFARVIAQELEQGIKTKDYDQLIIIAPPYMNGLLHQHFKPRVKKLVSQNITKDVLHLEKSKLTEFLRQHL